jgi:hypothetical protein
MALGLGSNGANVALDALLAAHTWVKLHIGDPGAAGTANAATETTRKQAAWAAASGGASSNTGALTWTAIAGSQDATHFTLWTASTAGSFGLSGTITANAYTAGDDYVVAIGDLDVSFPLAS